MNKWMPKRVQLERMPKSVFNKTFFNFVFSFMAIIAGVLLGVFVLGHFGGLE